MSATSKPRPAGLDGKKPNPRTVQAREFAARLAPIVAEIKAAGIVSSRKIAVELNDRNIRAPQGGIWGSGQVLSLMKWIEDA